MKVGFCIPLNDEWKKEIDTLKKNAPQALELICGIEPCLDSFNSIEALVAGAIDRNYYTQADNLKALFVPFVGINHLPAEELIRRGVSVFNCHSNAESVAEKALSLALAGIGRLVEYHNDLRNEIWHGFWVGQGKKDHWKSLYRKRCSILGVGAIGETLAALLKAFSCDVTGYRRRADAPKPPHFDRITNKLDEALSGADIVFAILPLTDATRGIIGTEEFKTMRGAYFVNVGRGDTVREEALYEALRDGVISGAGIDVWYTYPPKGSVHGAPSRCPIHTLPNVVLSPHVAGSTDEATALSIVQTVQNVGTWIRTGRADHKVDLRASY